MYCHSTDIKKGILPSCNKRKSILLLIDVFSTVPFHFCQVIQSVNQDLQLTGISLTPQIHFAKILGIIQVPMWLFMTRNIPQTILCHTINIHRESGRPDSRTPHYKIYFSVPAWGILCILVSLPICLFFSRKLKRQKKIKTQSFVLRQSSLVVWYYVREKEYIWSNWLQNICQTANLTIVVVVNSGKE